LNCQQNFKDNWKELAMKQAYCLASSVLVTSDGTMFEQIAPGRNKSGSYGTTRRNCNVRLSIAAANDTPLDMVKVAGDDCVEIRMPYTPFEYTNVGGYKFDFEDKGDEFEFCSSVFAPGKYAVTQNTGKLLFNFFSGDQTPEQWEQLLDDFRHSPQVVDRLVKFESERNLIH